MTTKTLFDKDLTLEEAKKLIKNGADVNQQSTIGRTPLFDALNVEVAELFINLGANVNQKDNSGSTPLHKAYFTSTIKLLIKNGANINAKDNQGFFVLDDQFCIDNIKYLIDHGAIGRRKTYQKFREYFSVEQQKAFDAFISITNNDDEFYQICLAYQNDIKNHVKIEIKEMDIL